MKMRSGMFDRQAQSIEEAYQALDPNPVPQDHPRYYVEPPPDMSPFRNLREEIKRSAETRFLITAQGRQGKSTELTRLSGNPELARSFEIFMLNANEELDLADVDYRDILILLMEKCIARLSPARLVEANKALGELAQEIWEKLGGKSPRLKGFPLWKALSLGARLGIEVLTRRAAREVAGAALTRLLQTLNLLIAQIERSAGKKALFVIDDLEKIPDPKTARKLFCEDGIAFREIRASLVVPVPLHVAYSPENKASLDNIGKTVSLPHIKIRERNGRPFAEGRKFLMEVVNARTAPDLFDDNLVDSAVSFSGGSVGKLIQLLRDATLQAITEGSRTVRRDHLARAVQADRNAFVRILDRKLLNILRQVAMGKQFPGDDPEAQRMLLFMNAVMEYMNGTWYDIYPVLEELLTPSG